MLVPDIFFDRCGSINQNQCYVFKCEDFDFIEGIFDLVRKTYQRKHKIIVITNQDSISRGYYSVVQFHSLTYLMCEQFSAANASIEKVCFSSHRSIACLDNNLKGHFFSNPHLKMILQSQKKLSIDLSRYVPIGDKTSAIQAGIATSVGTNLLFTIDCSNLLSGLKYELITTLREPISYLQQGLQ
jgi:D-glycero-D-manno-heptose 1,7-bisphosphate phosphatase